MHLSKKKFGGTKKKGMLQLCVFLLYCTTIQKNRLRTKTHNNNNTNNYDPYIHYQHTNTSLQTTFHILNTLQKDDTHSKHRREQDNTRSKYKTRQNKTWKIIRMLQIITIPTFNLNIQIHHFRTTFYLPGGMLQTALASGKSPHIGVWIPAISRIPTVWDRHVHAVRTTHAWQPVGAPSTISLNASGTGSLQWGKQTYYRPAKG